MTAESYLEAAAKLRREADSLPDNMRQAWLRGAERFEAIAAEIDTD